MKGNLSISYSGFGLGSKHSGKQWEVPSAQLQISLGRCPIPATQRGLLPLSALRFCLLFICLSILVEELGIETDLLNNFMFTWKPIELHLYS